MNTKPVSRSLSVALTILGIIGMLAGVIGLFLSPEIQRWFFLFGAVFMMVPALAYREFIFMVLQGVVLVSILASFLPVEPWIKGMIPFLVFVAAVSYLTASKRITEAKDGFGAFSLFILSLGYALQYYVFFIIAGTLLVLFSALEIRGGFKPAWLWLVLNLAFTISSIINL